MSTYFPTERHLFQDAFHGLTVTFALPQSVDSKAIDALIATTKQLIQSNSRIVLFYPQQKNIDICFQKQLPDTIHWTVADHCDIPTLAYSVFSKTAFNAHYIAVPTTTKSDFFHLIYQWSTQLHINRLLILTAQGGLHTSQGQRIGFLTPARLNRYFKKSPSAKQRSVLKLVEKLLKEDISGISLCCPQEVDRELFTYEGCGTFFAQRHYCHIRPLSFDHYVQASALIRRGIKEGFLLPRTPEQIFNILLGGVGAFLEYNNHLAGVGTLLTSPYKKEKTGEVAALYALTRFKGEGIGHRLLDHLILRAREKKLQTLFACVSRQQVVDFFMRHGFCKVEHHKIPDMKWQGYSEERKKKVCCLSLEL
ncbi:GNAT family N-acetyltransferase [Magnetococcales bacterium HHB-1]